MNQPDETRMPVKPGTTSALILILIAMLMLSACGQSKDAQALVAEAKQHQQKGDDKAAIIQLKNALQLSPDDAEIRFLLGTLYNKEGNIPAAEKELSQALRLGMESTRVLPELGQAWLGTGQFQKLLDETDKLASLENQVDLLVLRGNALLSLGKFQEAKEMFEQVLKDNGVDHVLEFRTILRTLVSRAQVNYNYTESDTLQMVRLMVSTSTFRGMSDFFPVSCN